MGTSNGLRFSTHPSPRHRSIVVVHPSLNLAGGGETRYDTNSWLARTRSVFITRNVEPDGSCA